MSEQPDWEYIDNLGDASPLDYGGMFLYRDKTGVYGFELEKLERESDDDDDSNFIVHRVCLDRCKEVDVVAGVYLVPFGYEASSWPHKVADYEEWFAKDLARVAATVGTTEAELRAALCSDDGKQLAWAYQCIGDHHGWDNLDSYPLTLTLAEVKERYAGKEIDASDFPDDEDDEEGGNNDEYTGLL